MHSVVAIMNSNQLTKLVPHYSKPRTTHVLYSGLGGHSAVFFALLEGGFMPGALHTVLFVGVESPSPEYIRRCDELKVVWRYVNKVANKGHFKFLLALIRELVAHESDILFLHGLAAMPAVALLKFHRPGLKPFVLVRETQANQLKSQRDWISMLLAHLFADRIVHLTAEAATGAALRLRRFVRPAKVSIVPNGLDTDFFAPIEVCAADKGVIRIGMQSRLQPNKDHETLISAFALLCKHHPGRNFHLHIAGDGSTFQAIKQSILEHGLKKRVTMHGTLDRTVLRDFLNGLDFYVHCTHGETMSTSIMQALSCGLPTIASNVSGVANMVRPEVGLLYNPGDPIDLADKLVGLINDPVKTKELRQRARSYAVKHYDFNVMVRAYHTLMPGDITNAETPKESGG
jgi:glycosyltransferase involved in cell wall biosynthesis